VGGPSRLLTRSALIASLSENELPAMSLPAWAQLTIIAVAVLLSPVLAFLVAIAVEIVIGILVEAGAPAPLAFVAAGTIGWLLLRKLWRRPGGAPVET
jgi:hypothetical protein